MFEDTVVSVRCPFCGILMEGWVMGSNHREECALTEYYSCPCGCRFSVEVVVERPGSRRCH